MSYVDFYLGVMEEAACKDKCNLIDVAKAGYIEEFNVGDKVWPVFIEWMHTTPSYNKAPKYLPKGAALTIVGKEDGFVKVDTPYGKTIHLALRSYICVPYCISPSERGCVPKDTSQYENRVEGSELLPVPSEDVVNHPSHYAGAIECKDAMIQQFGKDAYKTFCQLNAFKYIWRSNMKHETPDEDLAKANWYLTEYKELSQQAE